MIQLENVTKTYGTGESALSDVTLTIQEGEFVFLVGPSGSGKTTFFRLLIRDMLPTTGSVTVHDMNTSKMSRGKIPQLRRKIGIVFQDLKLLTDRTIVENILLPLYIAGVDSKVAYTRAEEVLSQVGILEHKEKFPVQLSGGELQRAAIARAIVFTPKIVLADEPTGNSESRNSEIKKEIQQT
jgi:cell division transport system ATP-binding protein